MPTQADYDKVNKHILKPMIEFYEMKVNQAQADAFVEDLCGYSADILDASWKQVRRESKYPPKLAHFVEASKAQLTPKESGYVATPQDVQIFRNDKALADSVMRTPIGQLALREGVGQSIWMLAYRDGIANFTEAEVRKQKASWVEACNRLASMKPSDFMAAKLIEFHDTIKAREEELYKKYYRSAA